MAVAGCSERKPAELPATVAAPASSASAGAASAGTLAGTARMVGLPDFSVLVQKQGPAVVNVITTRAPRAVVRPAAGETGDPLQDFLRRFMPEGPQGGAPEPRGRGLGSGFVISSDGYVLTNAHVVLDSDDVTVRLADEKREFKARVVGIDRRTDVALLKVDATGLPTVTLGNSADLKVGEWVAAIGSPFGFSNTITAGIVSAKGRTLPDESFVPFIQTDVAVNPGNSGGPLLNLKGEVVGINSMIYSGTGGYMGVSFAIPIEVALDVSKQLQATGTVSRGRLGVSIQELNKELAMSFKLDSAAGVLIAGVEPGSPADKAGLKRGDVILKYDGKAVDNAVELPRLVASSMPGTDATLDVWRQGASQTIKVTLGEFAVAAAARKSAETSQTPNSVGLAVSELPAAGRKALGVTFGVVVEAVKGPAEKTQIRTGDVIIAVENTNLTSLRQFGEIIAEKKPGTLVPLLVRRGDASLYVAVQVGTG
ncbi:MAG: DegQ family serine endoprotease [Bacteriovorax sp.]|nr:DegQ family serine endoprotease [Rhizobacter sp.]